MKRPREGYGPGPLVAAVALGVTAALWTWTAPGDPALWPASAADAGVEVHVLDNGFHTDLAVPRAALEARSGPLAEAVRGLPPGDWILIGWGDARFYVDQSPMQGRLPDGLRAFFRPGNPSVVMLNPETGDPAARFNAATRRTLRLSPEGFAALDRRLEAALELSSGRARLVTARVGDDARFYAGRETFWIGHLCNHWTVDLLGAAGLPVRPLRAVTSAEVLHTVSRADPRSATAKLDTATRRD